MTPVCYERTTHHVVSHKTSSRIPDTESVSETLTLVYLWEQVYYRELQFFSRVCVGKKRDCIYTLNFWARLPMCRKATVSFAMCVCPSEWNNSCRTGRIFMKFYFLVYFRKSAEKFQFSVKCAKNIGHFTWRQCRFTAMSGVILSVMRNVLDIICRTDQITHFLFNNSFLTIVLFMG